MKELFYFNAMQNCWIRMPDEVRDFMNTIPQIMVLDGQERVVKLKLRKTEMTEEEVRNLLNVVR